MPNYIHTGLLCYLTTNLPIFVSIERSPTPTPFGAAMLIKEHTGQKYIIAIAPVKDNPIQADISLFEKGLYNAN